MVLKKRPLGVLLGVLPGRLLGPSRSGRRRRLGGGLSGLTRLCQRWVEEASRTGTRLDRCGVCHPLLALATHEGVEGRVGVGDLVGEDALLSLRRNRHLR